MQVHITKISLLDLLWTTLPTQKAPSLSLLIGSLSKHSLDGTENVSWKCNLMFLQSFLSDSKSSFLQNVFHISWNWIGTTASEVRMHDICHHMLKWSTQLQNRSIYIIERMRTPVKCPKMKNACAKHAKLLFFIIKFPNLWLSCFSIINMVA